MPPDILAVSAVGVQLVSIGAGGQSSQCTQWFVPARQIAISDDALYMLDQNSVQIWDVSDPCQPMPWGSFTITGSMLYDERTVVAHSTPAGVWLMWGATDGTRELVIIADVTNHSNPLLCHEVELQHPNGFWVIPAQLGPIGSTLYVAGWRPPFWPNFPYHYYLVEVDITGPCTASAGPFYRVSFLLRQ